VRSATTTAPTRSAGRSSTGARSRTRPAAE
jgi:hypothetical protein